MLTLLSFSLAMPLAAGFALEQRQANNTISSNIEQGINTECKTCPYSLCPNTIAYGGSDENVTLSCWTEGTDVNGDNTWLGVVPDGVNTCYITQWDLIEYAGDYRTDLPYCGAIPQVYTTTPSRTIYYTECNIIPQFSVREDRVKMYKPEVDLTLTCYTFEGAASLSDTTWYKTLSNCYVPAAQIEPVDNNLIDPCGPIPFMEAKMRQPDAEPEPLPEPEPVPEATVLWARESLAATASALDKRWLYTTFIGFDDVNCYSEADATSTVVRPLPYGAYIIVQCATFGPPEADRQIYLLTTEFCWVNDTLTDPQLVDSVVRSERYPNCIDFVDTEV